jgi:hypothetical protein
MKHTEIRWNPHTLKLSEREYQSSIPLRQWTQKHKDSKYIPQDLLEAWGIELEL